MLKNAVINHSVFVPLGYRFTANRSFFDFLGEKQIYTHKKKTRLFRRWISGKWIYINDKSIYKKGYLQKDKRFNNFQTAAAHNTRSRGKSYKGDSVKKFKDEILIEVSDTEEDDNDELSIDVDHDEENTIDVIKNHLPESFLRQENNPLRN